MRAKEIRVGSEYLVTHNGRRNGGNPYYAEVLGPPVTGEVPHRGFVPSWRSRTRTETRIPVRLHPVDDQTLVFDDNVPPRRFVCPREDAEAFFAEEDERAQKEGRLEREAEGVAAKVRTVLGLDAEAEDGAVVLRLSPEEAQQLLVWGACSSPAIRGRLVDYLVLLATP